MLTQSSNLGDLIANVIGKPKSIMDLLNIISNARQYLR
jgi:hypothetical protein